MRSSEFGGGDDRGAGEPSSVVPVGPIVPITRPRALPLVVIDAAQTASSAVTLSADATGSGFQIAISFQERRAP